jgi:quinol monooxygenase YgiN
MILEVAVLDVRAGEGARFEQAFQRAEPLIKSAAGYQRHELRRCLEAPDRYLLLVSWASLEDHTRGFRGSAAYQEWKALLHHFYEPFPVVEHYAPLVSDDPVSVVVRIRAREGREAEVRRELLELLAPTRAERGCLGYDMHEMPEEPTLFLFHETWASEADLDRHLMEPHVQSWIAKADALLAEPMQLSRWRKH